MSDFTASELRDRIQKQAFEPLGPNGWQVIYVVTLEDHGFNYLTSRNTWCLEHDEALAFPTDEAASMVAARTKGASVLCSARQVIQFPSLLQSSEDERRNELNAPSHEQVEDARINARLDARAEYEDRDDGRSDGYGESYAERQ